MLIEDGSGNKMLEEEMFRRVRREVKLPWGLILLTFRVSFAYF